MRQNKGFILPLLLIILGALIVAGISFGIYKFRCEPKNQAATMVQNVPAAKTSEETANLSSKAQATEDWKTYTSFKGKFEIKYPSDMRINIGEPVGKQVESISLHSQTSLVLTVTVFSETGNVNCDSKNFPPKDIFEKVIIDGENGCFSEGKNIDNSSFEIRTYYLVHKGPLYALNFTWKSGEKDSKLFDQILSTFKFL